MCNGYSVSTLVVGTIYEKGGGAFERYPILMTPENAPTNVST